MDPQQDSDELTHNRDALAAELPPGMEWLADFPLMQAVRAQMHDPALLAQREAELRQRPDNWGLAAMVHGARKAQGYRVPTPRTRAHVAPRRPLRKRLGARRRAHRTPRRTNAPPSASDDPGGGDPEPPLAPGARLAPFLLAGDRRTSDSMARIGVVA
jgi:hypothetical protein